MQNHLVIVSLGQNQLGIVDQFSKAIKDSGCNIVDSRMTVLGGEIAMILMVSGTWNAIAKIEDMLPRLEERLDLSITAKRTDSPKPAATFVPYAVDVVSLDRLGIVNDIAHFFATRDINIQDMYTNSYHADHTGTPMFSLHMTINIPSRLSIAALRGEFMDFCDHLNLDAIIEPVK
ncbi:MAG: glycine cleavage system protein R [Gammaproteobacteria bacterium]